ncbi:choline/ethanolamine kinase [Zalerion maritima]|uniref:ethanolamine kinase n=1 Tax=Zalerion maritima TaxID=339359 RepID=A0AAD5WU80_9PEZI|nr:choline/ethanolamine kinase [Zalerion maritima]
MPPAQRNGLNGNGPEHMLDDVEVPFISIKYEGGDASALKVVTALRPEWSGEGTNIVFTRFTDGITNTLLKAVNKREGLSKEEIDNEAVLLRAYGHGTDILIDRQRETQNHELLMKCGLAPELLARFENGMLYRFIRGTVTNPNDLRRPTLYKAVARRLAEWHVRVPCITKTPMEAANGHGMGTGEEDAKQAVIDNVAPGKPVPNMWTVVQKWIMALPTDTLAQRERQKDLQKELERIVREMSQRPGLGKDGLVFAHCDLLSGNIIVLLKDGTTTPNPSTDENVVVSFIDYEYAVPSPAAFDISNHFAEWAGFDCDFGVLPTVSQRRDFISTYIYAYHDYKGTCGAKELLEKEVDKLMAEVDLFRGVPGFYWGIWALIQATISDIEFDYASYAELRLSEYWAWREELEGTREKEGKEMPLRERRWAQAE